MTTQTGPINYAAPRAAGGPDGARGYTGVAAALALAVGFLGANTFADAAGLPAPQDANRDASYVALRVLCGVVVFVVTFAVVAFVFREVRALVHTLARTPNRPGLPIAMAALICGTACVIAALALQLYGLRNPTGVTIGPTGVSIGGAQVSTQTPLMAHIATILAFLLGVGLIAIGIWSSMGQTASIPANANTAATPPLP